MGLCASADCGIFAVIAAGIRYARQIAVLSLPSPKALAPAPTAVLLLSLAGRAEKVATGIGVNTNRRVPTVTGSVSI